MSWTLTTSGAAVLKAGYYANSAIKVSGSSLASWDDEIEGLICGIARSNVVANYASLTANGKTILGNLASNMIAQKIIAYDATGVSSRVAETILDVIENDIRRAISIITEDKNKTYLGIVS